MANIPTTDLIIYHLDWNLTARCFHCWSTGLTKRKLPMQCTKRLEVYAKETQKPSLHIITLKGGSVAYSSYHSISFFIQLWFFLLILATHMMKYVDYCKIVEENFNFVSQDILEKTWLKTLMVFSKPWVKHLQEFSRFFSLNQFIDWKKKIRW